MLKYKRLIFICENDLTQQIGGTIHVKELLISLVKLKPNVTLIAPNYHGEKISVAPGIETIFIKTKNVRILKWLIFYLESTIAILRLFLKYKTIVIYSREMPYNIFLSMLCRVLQIPLFIELNGVFLSEMKDLGYSRFSYRISGFLEKAVLKPADKIICVSDEIKKRVSSELGLPKSKFITIPNGTDIDIFHPKDRQQAREILNLPRNKFIIGFIGSCYPYHDIDTLIYSISELVRSIPQIYLVVAGDGFMLKKWKHLALSLNLNDYVYFAGYVPFDQANDYINSYDICFASYKKGTSVFPMKIMDYLACNKPVITSNIQSVNKYFKNLSFLRITEPEKKAIYVETILEIYSKKNEVITSHREFVIRNFTWYHTANKIVKTISQTLKHA